MAIEIERRFFVTDKFNDLDLSAFKSSHYTQGYLSLESSPIIRVRLTDTSGYMTIKSKTSGIGSFEYEFPIPKIDAEALLTMCHHNLINKRRYIIPNGELNWEVDLFEDLNYGLIIAEIEIPTEDTTFDIPEWIGEEITSLKNYSNFELSKTPMSMRTVNKVNTDVYEVVRKIVVEHIPDYTSIVLTGDFDLRLAYIDSLDMVEIIMTIEDHYEIEITIESLHGIKTINELVNVTEKALNK
jgi:acyl carrier protein